MKYLLDTHAAVWALEESPHLSPRVRDLILDRSPADFVIADVTILEVACLIRSSRLPRKGDPVARLEKLCALFLPCPHNNSDRLAGGLAGLGASRSCGSADLRDGA